jgi:hypothetical protein
VEFDRKDISMNKLGASTLEGKFQIWDMRTQHPREGFASVSEKVSLSFHAYVLRQNKSSWALVWLDTALYAFIVSDERPLHLKTDIGWILGEQDQLFS